MTICVSLSHIGHDKTFKKSVWIFIANKTVYIINLFINLPNLVMTIEKELFVTVHDEISLTGIVKAK